jgi:hypothetical protein
MLVFVIYIVSVLEIKITWCKGSHFIAVIELLSKCFSSQAGVNLLQEMLDS